ncbi:MAG: hypothetical protein ACLQGP_04895 [Isosphaeraceae bacterium]
MQDIGTGGFNGFLDGNIVQNTYFPGGHGAALKPSSWDHLNPPWNNYDSLAQFVLKEANDIPPGLLVESESRWATLAWKLCWLVWLVLAAIVAACVAALILLPPFWPWGVLGLVLFVAALVLVLYSI